MKPKKFTYFPNHGDEEGRNRWTISFGDPDEGNNIIVGAEDRKKDAIYVCKQLNEILRQHSAKMPVSGNVGQLLSENKKVPEVAVCEHDFITVAELGDAQCSKCKKWLTEICEQTDR